MKVKLTLIEDMLGTTPADPAVHAKWVASLAPDAMSMEEEVAAVGVDQAITNCMTIFPKENEVPFVWDYQIRGFFKDSCGMLARIKPIKNDDGKLVPRNLSSQIKAYKKVVDGLIFVKPRKVFFTRPSDPVGDPLGQMLIQMGNCQRSGRWDTPLGPRTALINSESVPEGSCLTFDIILLDSTHESLVREWLDYGELHGLGQWRNSGKGKFTYEIIES